MKNWKIYRITIIMFVAAGLAGFGSSSVTAMVLVLNNGNRVTGWFVREEAGRIILRIEEKGGTSKEVSYALSDCAVILPAGEPLRLSALQPEKPDGYRDYAEELAARRDDPEARALAERLFLIAGFLAPERLGRGCLQSLSTLTDNPNQARRCLALAFRIDPRHDRSLLQLPTDPGAKTPGFPPGRKLTQPENEALRALLSHRLGGFVETLRLLDQPAVAEVLGAALKPDLTLDEFRQSCQKSAAALSPENAAPSAPASAPGTAATPPQRTPTRQVAVTTLLIYRVEGRILSRALDPEGRVQALPPASASDLRRSLWWGNPEPASLPQWENLTKYDPRANRFQNGAWVQPAALSANAPR